MVENRPEFDFSLLLWPDPPAPLWAAMSGRRVMSFLAASRLEGGPTRVSSRLRLAELAGIPVVTHARILLEALSQGDGAKLTATGNLSRRFVAEMLDRFDWPGYPKEDVLYMNKVVNETDFTVLHYLRVLMGEAGLTRRRKGHMKPSRRGRDLLADAAAGELMHRLFTTNFDVYNTGYLDFIVIEEWPQEQIGLVLFLLSEAAGEWATADELMRKTSIPTRAVLSTPPSLPGFVFARRVLEYLVWFGLLERRPEHRRSGIGVETMYRKTALYDRFLGFELDPENRWGRMH